MSSPELRGCPTCGCKDHMSDLGLRDYTWVSKLFPGRVAPMDVDFLLERNGDFLALEFKPKGVKAGRGQEITFQQLRKKGFEVWTVEGDGPGLTDSSRLRVHWNDVAYADMKRKTLANTILKWFEARTRVMRKPNGGSNEKAEGPAA